MTNPTAPERAVLLAADDLPEILRRNPYIPWLHPLRWWRWRRTEILYQSYSQMRVGLDDWERQWLIPQLKGRLESFARLFEKIKEICTNQNVRLQLGPAIKELGAAPDDADPNVVADDYLNNVASQVDTDFLPVINQATKAADTITDLKGLLRFANAVRFIASQITSTETILFWYNTWLYPIILDLQTRKPIRSAESREFGIILLPFKNAVFNLTSIATTTSDVIDHWAKQLSERKKPFLEYLAADGLLRANRLIVLIQLLIILVAIAASTFFATAADPIGTLRKNAELEDRLRKAEQAISTKNAELQQLTDQAKLLQQQRDEASVTISRLREENAALQQNAKQPVPKK